MVGHLVVQRKEKMGEGGGVWMEADSLNSTFSEKKKKKKMEKQPLKTNQTDPTLRERAPLMTNDYRETFPMEACSVVPLLPHRRRKKRKRLCLVALSLSPVVATTAERKR